jgi:hypothetical protein
MTELRGQEENGSWGFVKNPDTSCVLQLSYRALYAP